MFEVLENLKKYTPYNEQLDEPVAIYSKDSYEYLLNKIDERIKFEINENESEREQLIEDMFLVLVGWAMAFNDIKGLDTTNMDSYPMEVVKDFRSRIKGCGIKLEELNK